MPSTRASEIAAIAPVRWSKIVLVGTIAAFMSLVAFTNVTDYGSNFQFVTHVLSMDTTFPGNRSMWRAITAPAVHHAAYVFIILVETSCAVLCWIGTVRLYLARGAAAGFDGRKTMAIAGLTLSWLLWFFGFMTIAAEWFLMWQSKTWNGQESAFRLAALTAVVLVYLVIPDDRRER